MTGCVEVTNVCRTFQLENVVQNDHSHLNFRLWSCKAATLSLVWQHFSVLRGKNSDYVEDAVMRMRAN